MLQIVNTSGSVLEMYEIKRRSFLSSAHVHAWTLVAKSLVGFTISGLAKRPSQSAFIRMRQALGANSPDQLVRAPVQSWWQKTDRK